MNVSLMKDSKLFSVSRRRRRRRTASATHNIAAAAAAAGHSRRVSEGTAAAAAAAAMHLHVAASASSSGLGADDCDEAAPANETGKEGQRSDDGWSNSNVFRLLGVPIPFSTCQG